MYAFIQPSVSRPRARALFPETCAAFVRGLPLRPPTPPRRTKCLLMQATDESEQRSAAVPPSTEYLDSLQDNVTDDLTVKTSTELETETDAETSEEKTEGTAEMELRTESEASVWWADAAIYLVLTAFAAVFSFNERRRLLAAFLGLMTTPTITVTAWKALVRRWHSSSSAEHGGKRFADKSTGIKWLTTDARIDALAATASDRDISVIRALSALDARLDSLQRVAYSTSADPSADLSAFSQAAELRALRTRVARLDTASAELYSRLAAAEAARIDAEHAARVAETELRAARAVDHALRIRLAEAEAKASRLTSLQSDLDTALREIDTLRVKVESDARASEELRLSASDAESRASRFESLVESLRERISPRRRDSSGRRDMSRRRASDSADGEGERDRGYDDSSQNEDRAFWRRELERKAGRLVPDSIIAEELRSPSRETSSPNWPSAPLSGGTRPSRVDGLPADGGFATVDKDANTDANSSADESTTEGENRNSSAHRLPGTQKEGTFAFSRDEFDAGDSPVGSLPASPEAIPLPAATEDESSVSSEDGSSSSTTGDTSSPMSTEDESSASTTGDTSSPTSTEDVPSAQSTETEQTDQTDQSEPTETEKTENETKKAETEQTENESKSVPGFSSLETSENGDPASKTTESGLLPKSKDAIPLPASSDPNSLPASAETTPLPAAAEATPLPAAAEATPLPAAAEAIPLPAATESTPLPSANESTTHEPSSNHTLSDSKYIPKDKKSEGTGDQDNNDTENIGANVDAATTQPLSYLGALEEKREGEGNNTSEQQKDVRLESKNSKDGTTDGEVSNQLGIKMVERRTEFVDADMTVKAVEMGESALEDARVMESAGGDNSKARKNDTIDKDPSVDELLRTAKELVKRGRRRGLSISKADGYFREASGNLEEALERVEKFKANSSNKSTGNLKSVVEGALGSCLVAWAKVNIADNEAHDRLERAKSLLQHRVDDASDDTGALFSAGLCFCLLAATGAATESRNLYEQACKMYERLLEVDEKSRIACFNCGLTYISLARLAAADNDLSNTGAEREWLQKATARFEEVLKLKPGDTKAQAYVDDCRRQLNAMSTR